MQKFTPPPIRTQMPDLENVLRQLYRRRLAVRRLIRSLEVYSTIQGRHKSFLPTAVTGVSGHHIN